jgi:hypothetical protein
MSLMNPINRNFEAMWDGGGSQDMGDYLKAGVDMEKYLEFKKVIGIEKDKRYFEIAKNRINEYK